MVASTDAFAVGAGNAGQERSPRAMCPCRDGMHCFREDRLSAPAGGWLAVGTGLPRQPGLPRLPVHAVHPARILAHALP